jgi:predicted acylesterase/phospholipase RssA
MIEPIKILSIDGGGIRGLIPAFILTAIEDTTGKPIADLFDLIAGTSTGGLLALGLAIPADEEPSRPKYKAEVGIQLYSENGRRIFDRSTLRKIKTVYGLFDELYNHAELETVLVEYFGETMLSQALAPLLITTYDIEEQEQRFFKSKYAADEPDIYDLPMTVVARATSAAPTYFEPLKISQPGKFEGAALIDGGVVANNPAMCAYVEAPKYFGGERPVMMVSLGTGMLPAQSKRISYQQAKDWGKLGWILNGIIDIFMSGSVNAIDHQMGQLLDAERYFRFQPDLVEEVSSLDSVSPEAIERLTEIARRLVDDKKDAIEKICEMLTG